MLPRAQTFTFCGPPGRKDIGGVITSYVKQRYQLETCLNDYQVSVTWNSLRPKALGTMLSFVTCRQVT